MLRSLPAALAGCCLLALSTAPATAADADEAEGVVRLTPPKVDAELTPASHCPDCQTDTAAGGHVVDYGGMEYGGMAGCPDCPQGHFGGCPGGCPSGRCPAYGMDPFGNKLRCMTGIFGGVSHAPGEGYVTPARRPMWDLSLPTSTMWSGQWTCGRGGAHPSTRPAVYMPTDTTQLGYSYSHVPYWMPKAGMVPPVPNPSDFHVRACLGRCGKGCRNAAAAYHGGIVSETQPVPVIAGTEGLDLTTDNAVPQIATQPILPEQK